MIVPLIRGITRAAFCSIAIALGSGCEASRRGGFEEFVPEAGPARAALMAALEAWRDDRPRNSVASTPAFEFVDSVRDPSRPLRSFEILGPVGADGPRCFAVRLALDNPPQEQIARYLVVGKAPLWVFRQEDYERIAHWEHKMEEGPASGGSRPPGLGESKPQTPPTPPDVEVPEARR